ncbi:MAG: DUF1385 domain-containing protein [Desulfovibrio sp.]|nr:DUF1385 domain-containing protein [Desulfovibrio sp.]
MDGVMMRNGEIYGLAVRRPDGCIVAIRRPWFSFFSSSFFALPCVRGFSVLVDTLYNGVSALNQSVALGETDESQKLTKWQLVVSMIISVVFAVLLFVLAPHFLSLLMFWLDAGGDVEGLSFHLWDGFYKACIFLLYLWGISLLPEIQRVLSYHGAEHKTIHAFEKSDAVTVDVAQKMSRFHPRCGTTFLLFVISLSILLHAVFVPPLIALIHPSSELLKHALTLVVKIAFIVPISAFSYEMIRFAAKRRQGLVASLLRAPGLCLQRLTTREPSIDQLAVALVSLHMALEGFEKERVHTEAYTVLDEALLC